MTSFDLWWTAEVGHPPADDRERYAFEMARKAWVIMPVEFRQKLTAIQQMLTIADTREERMELSDSLIRLGRTVEPEVRPTECEECGEMVTDAMLVADRRLCVSCGCHACEICGAMDSETINGMDRCLEHTEGKLGEESETALAYKALDILRVIEEAGKPLTFTEIRDRLRDRRKKTTTP